MARGLEWGRPEYAGPCHLDDVVLDKVIHGHDACADHMRPSGLEGAGDSARALARRLRAYGVLRVFQQHELASGLSLPEGEIEL